MGLRRVVENFDGGQSFAVGETRFGEESLGLFGIELQRRHAFIARDAWRHIARSGGLAALEHVAGEFFAVRGEGEGLADALVVEGGAGRVQAVHVHAEVRVDVNETGLFFLILGDLVLGQVARQLDLARAKATFFRAQIVDGVEPDAIQAHLVPVPIVLVAHDFNDLVGPPLG